MNLEQWLFKTLGEDLACFVMGFAAVFAVPFAMLVLAIIAAVVL